ncbi:MAG: dipeptidase PepE [Bacteroidota bacterium]
MILLLSNSTTQAGYLTHGRDWIADALGSARRVAFVPYASVTISYADYADRVRDALDGLGLEITSVHEADKPARAVQAAEAVFVGGGNTFHLLREMHLRGLIQAIRKHVQNGGPYVGWSAGANVACPSIRTTNDMPIVEPPTLDALRLVPVQINPHYTDAHPDGHQGETRAERLAEFVTANPEVPAIGLPEGTGLRLDASGVHLLGGRARLFDRDSPQGRAVSEEEMEGLLAP